jgi:hypothetical protein
VGGEPAGDGVEGDDSGAAGLVGQDCFGPAGADPALQGGGGVPAQVLGEVGDGQHDQVYVGGVG